MQALPVSSYVDSTAYVCAEMKRPVPNFFVVGAQKTATTSLHHYLCHHPEIFLPSVKETHFFVMDERYDRGVDHYLQTYFSDWKGQPLVGEVDPDYMYFEEALERMANAFDLEDVRFIFLFRNPVDRAYSHYLMTRRRGHEDLSFTDAILCERERLSDGWFAREHYSYFSRGLYFRQVSRFLERVEHSQMLFLLTEDLEKDPLATLRQIFVFLGVDDDYVPSNVGQRFHQARAARSLGLIRRIRGPDTLEKRLIRMLVPSAALRQRMRKGLLAWNQVSLATPALDVATRRWLAHQYVSDNALLQDLIARDLSHWNS